MRDPEGPNGRANVTVSASTQKFRTWGRLKAKWRALQVGRQGSYSIERLESLDHYCKTTSRTRVMLVCVLTPLPSLAVILLLECLPLRPPSEGWAANWVFWIRLGGTVFTMVFAGMAQLVTFVPNLNTSLCKAVIVACGASFAYVATALLGAEAIAFPIPMMWILGGSFMSIYVPGMALLVFGLSPFAKTAPCRPNLQRFSRYFFSYMTLAGVFPFCKVIYEFIPAKYRWIAIAVLPLWRLAAKQVMVQATRELEDFMPEIVAFTVDFFSALFVSVCMSTSGSIELAVLFIAADAGHSLLELHDVRELSKSIGKLLRRQQKALQGEKHHKSEQQASNLKAADLVSMILAVTRAPDTFRVKSFAGARLWACLPHPIATEHKQRLHLLGASDSFSQDLPSSNSLAQSPTTIHAQRPQRFQGASIVPAPSIVLPGPAPADITKAINRQPEMSDGNTRIQHHEGPTKIVQQGLQALFHWEYVALVEYVECVVPLVFVVFKLVLERLPNAVYYPGGPGSFTSASILNILAFGLMEVGSLLLLNHFLQRKFAFSPLYQLAFVLETQMRPVQTKLFIETILLLQYELAHLGTDFTFRFQWLHTKQH